MGTKEKIIGLKDVKQYFRDGMTIMYGGFMGFGPLKD
jgi:acyl CoA:acetate/3-ketoacid CoA transferase alpha subunit